MLSPRSCTCCLSLIAGDISPSATAIPCALSKLAVAFCGLVCCGLQLPTICVSRRLLDILNSLHPLFPHYLPLVHSYGANLRSQG